MPLCAYSLIVSAVYAALAIAWPSAAAALVVFFIALLLVPEGIERVRRRRKMERHDAGS